MNYNDDIVISNDTANKMSMEYTRESLENLDDLQEILDKMIDERNKLQDANNPEYTEIIERYDKNIADLENLIGKIRNSRAQQLQMDDTDAVSPIRSDIEMGVKNVSSTRKRHRPMQIPRFFPIFPPFNLNMRKRRKKCDGSHPPHHDIHPNTPRSHFDTHNLRYHNMTTDDIVDNQCCDHRSLVTHQQDICRLLLLYIMLGGIRPHHHDICELAYDQYEILLALSE